MSFPLPLRTEFRKELIRSWIVDVEDRIELGSLDGAISSLSEAHSLIMSLPPGEGDPSLESMFLEARVNIERYKTKLNHENNH